MKIEALGCIALLYRNVSVKHYLQILDAEQDLIEESLEYEKKQLDAERQWELLRLKREKEAEEEMKEQIRLKEDELIEELKRLGEEKDNKDEENNNLREQLKVSSDG